MFRLPTVVKQLDPCYCSNVRGRVVASARAAARTAPAQRRRRRLLALLCHYSCAGQRRRPRGGTAMLQAIECASTYELRGEGESPDCANVGLPPPVLAYCCSRGLLFTIVVHQGYCCSVVTVNNNNTVQKLTFGNSTHVPVRKPSQLKP